MGGLLSDRSNRDPSWRAVPCLSGLVVQGPHLGEGGRFLLTNVPGPAPVFGSIHRIRLRFRESRRNI